MSAKITTAIILSAAILAGCGALSQETFGQADMPGAAFLEAAALEEAVAMMAESKYAEAAAQLSPLARRLELRQDRKRASESLFWLAYCYEKLGRTGEAARLYGQIVEEHDAQPVSRQAAYRLSQIPESDRL